jgi:hypothetical protein
MNTDEKTGEFILKPVSLGVLALFGTIWHLLSPRFEARHENLLPSVQKLDRFLTETDLVFPDQFLT